MFMIKEIWLNLRIPMYIQEADFWINSPPAPATPRHPVLGLCYCVRAFSSCDEWGLLLVVLHVLLIVVASLVLKDRL